MKKRKLLWLLALIFIFCACTPTPNMEELLTYQADSRQMEVRIKDGEAVFHAEITYKEDAVLLIFTDGERKGVGYRMGKNEKIAMFYKDFEIALTDDAYLKCCEWFSLLHLSASATIWQVKKEMLGGIEVFVCHDGMVTVYIDCNTRKPLKMEKGNLEIDILEYQ